MEPSIGKCRQILSVSENASLDEVKEAYLDLAKIWHPDRFAGNPRLEKKANAKLAEINEAYHALVAYYESGIATPAPEPEEEVRPEEEAAPEPAGTETPVRRGFTMTVIILCALAVLAAGIYTFTAIRARKFVAPVRVIMPPESTETTQEPTPSKKAPHGGSLAIHGKAAPDKAEPQKKVRARATSFSLGAAKDEVLAVQGEPTLMSDTRWNYGSSYVDFQKGKVAGWYNSNLDPLRVKIGKQGEGEDAYFTLGSTKEEVASVQGTPMQIAGSRWTYGFSRVDFQKGKVAGWYNSNLDPLRVKMVPKTEADRSSFTIGSTKAEVLAIQGTPTQLTESRWSYGYSYIEFEDGKVRKWYNSEQDPLAVEEE